MNYSGKKVMVTGGAGFIGSTLVRELLKEGAEVTVYDNLFSGHLSNLEEVLEEIEMVEGDILDPAFGKVLEKHEIEYIFNLAAEPYIPDCYERPKKFFEVNANGTLNVMLAAKEAGVKRIVQYSTSEVYGSAKYVPMCEHHPTLPLSTYAVSKLAADRLCYTIHHEQGIPVVILRQFNTYGPRETQPYIIPELITQLSQWGKLRLGNIKARRDFTYVEDAARGAMALMKEKGAEGEVFNLGFGRDASIEELAYLVGELMGHKKVKITIDEARLRPLDVERLQANYFKAYRLTGWEPRVELKEGLGKTIDWFKEHGGKWIWETKVAPEDKIWRSKRRAS
ncbi:MAG: GDP-mannose 4,6-dehydratase [Candidatus Hydrothermarchaeota archaeon]